MLRSTGLGCSPAQRKSAVAAAAPPPPPPSSSRLPSAQAAAPWDRPSSSSGPNSNQSIAQQIADMERKITETVNTRFDEIDGRLDSIEGRLDKIEGIFNPSIWTVLRFLGNLILTASAVVIIVCSFLLIMRGGV
ncbi:hypothetical protein COHA_001818 [Chlorella ohadii]|uniref:t-SNARE coiled-coil homology domain-containing protein n=1 Tax=Chlorella ohadii TaxID=2649997 RepID=A0AAD5H805_9CHLO|nr:hypothetical protein COHA_001818 [Chlorella ohadii]